MTHDYANMKLIDIRKLPGVADLSMKVGGKFALALKAEANGDHDEAERHLRDAVVYEEAGL